MRLRLVDDGDVRLDPFAFDQPAQHLGRAVDGVGDQFPGVEAEAVAGAHDHVHGGAGLGLPDRRGGLHIDDHRVVLSDDVVGGVGVERPVAVGGGEPRRGIGGQVDFRLDRRGGAEGRIVERVEIFLRGASDLLERPVLRVDLLEPAGVGGDQRGVYAESVPADKPLSYAARRQLLEQMPEQVACRGSGRAGSSRSSSGPEPGRSGRGDRTTCTPG